MIDTSRENSNNAGCQKSRITPVLASTGRIARNSSHATTMQVINRLRAIILQIDAQPNAKAAWELNTYAKAEIARILNLRVRLMAANQQREATHAQHLVADRLSEREFMQMGVPN